MLFNQSGRKKNHPVYGTTQKKIGRHRKKAHTPPSTFLHSLAVRFRHSMCYVDPGCGRGGNFRGFFSFCGSGPLAQVATLLLEFQALILCALSIFEKASNCLCCAARNEKLYTALKYSLTLPQPLSMSDSYLSASRHVPRFEKAPPAKRRGRARHIIERR